MNSSDEEKQLELLASLKDQGRGGRCRRRLKGAAPPLPLRARARLAGARPRGGVRRGLRAQRRRGRGAARQARPAVGGFCCSLGVHGPGDWLRARSQGPFCVHAER